MLTIAVPVRVGAASSPPAVPEVTTYTGQLRVDGGLYTGDTLWRFALVTSTGGVLWTNDGSATLPPAAGLVRKVAAGRVSIALGEQRTLTDPMQALPSGAFTAPRTYLRAWVAAPTTAQPEELLAAEQPVPHAQAFTSVPYSHRAARAAQADEADIAHGLAPASDGQPIHVQGDLVVHGRIVDDSSRVGAASSPPDDDDDKDDRGKRGRVTFDTVTTRHLIVTDSVSLPGGAVVTSTVTQVQTLVVQTSATFTGPVVVKEGLAIGEDTIYVGAAGANGIANAITYTAVPAAAPAQIRTSATGPANTSNPAPTGAVPLTINAGATGAMNLNTLGAGPILMKGPNAGSVGIGSTAPGARLNVVPEAAGVVGQVVQGAAGQTADLQQWQDSAGTVLTRVDSAGRVGVGLAPGAGFTLDVAGAQRARAAHVVHPTSDAPVLLEGGPGSRRWTVQSRTTGKFAITDMSTPGDPERLNISPAGDVGIGLSTGLPSALLDVNGTARVRGALSADTDATVGGNLTVSGQLNAANGVSFDAGTLHVDSVNKRVGVGTTLPGTKLDVAGDARTRGTHLVDGALGVGTASPQAPLHVANPFLESGSLLRLQGGVGAWDFTHNGGNMTGDLGIVDVGGTERVLIQRGTGRVGIGTVSPLAQLEVAQADDTDATTAFRVQTGAGAFATDKFAVTGAGNAIIRGGGDTGPSLFLRNSVNGANWEMGLDGNMVGDFELNRSPGSRDLIVQRSDGHVGIGGALDSAARFHVEEGDVSVSRVNGPVELRLMSLFGAGRTYALRSTAAGQFQVVDSPGTPGEAVRVTVASDGKVGVGTPAPAAALHLRGQDFGNPLLRLEDAATGKRWDWRIAGQDLRLTETGNTDRVVVRHGGANEWRTRGGAAQVVEMFLEHPDTASSAFRILRGLDGAPATLLNLSPAGDLTVAGGLTVSGAVDGVDVSAHTHTGGVGDAPQIPTAGLAAGAVTAAKTALGGISAVSGKVPGLTSAAFDSLKGSAVTDLNASALQSGTVDAARLPATVVQTDQPNIFTAAQTVSGANLTVTSPGVLSGNGSGLTNVTADTVQDGAITTNKIAKGAVTTPKLADGAATGTKLGSDVARTDTSNTFTAAQTVSGANLIVTRGDAATAVEVANTAVDAQGVPTGRAYALQSATDGRLVLQDSTAGAERVAVTSGGNVGINTPTPVEKFEVHGGNIVAVRSDAATDVRVANTAASGKTYALRATPDGKFQVIDSPGTPGETVRATVASDGKVGIDTVSPGARLDIQQVDETAATTALRVQTGATPTTKFSVDGAGNAQVSGQVKFTGAGTVTAGGANQNLTVQGSGTGNILLAPTGGKVGINTPAPNAPLEIRDEDTSSSHKTLRITHFSPFKGGQILEKFVIDGWGNATFGGGSFGKSLKMRIGSEEGTPSDFQIRTNADLTQSAVPDFPEVWSWRVRIGSFGDNFLVERRPRLDLNPGAGFETRFKIDQGGNTFIRTPVGPGGAAQLWLVNTVQGESYALQVGNGGSLGFASGGAVRVRFDPDGHIFAHNAQFHAADVAEKFETTVPVSTGQALVADPAHPGWLTLSTKPRDPAFAGIVSGNPGLTLGSAVNGPAVGITGRLLAWVSVENGAVRPGTPLTTAETDGHLMAADSQTPAAAIVGIALGNLEVGTGMIEVLLK